MNRDRRKDMQLKRRNTLNEVKDMNTGIPSSDECLSVWKAPGDVFQNWEEKGSDGKSGD